MVQGRRCAGKVNSFFESCVLSSCGLSTLRISISESLMLSLITRNRARSTHKSIRCFPLWSLNLNLIIACRFVYRIIARTREMKHVLWIQIYFISLFLARLRTFSTRPRTLFGKTLSNRLLQPDLESSFAQRECKWGTCLILKKFTNDLVRWLR